MFHSEEVSVSRVLLKQLFEDIDMIDDLGYKSHEMGECEPPVECPTPDSPSFTVVLDCQKSGLYSNQRHLQRPSFLCHLVVP